MKWPKEVVRLLGLSKINLTQMQFKRNGGAPSIIGF